MVRPPPPFITLVINQKIVPISAVKKFKKITKHTHYRDRDNFLIYAKIYRTIFLISAKSDTSRRGGGLTCFDKI